MTSRYRTRLRSQLEKQAAKYDEIFAAVVDSSRSSLCSETSTSDVSISSSITEEQSTIESSKVKRQSYRCSYCKAIYEKHIQLHGHIALEHGKALVMCSSCKATSRTLWRTNVCRICRCFTSNLAEHEADHYRDKKGVNALFECPNCYRSFARFEELKEHIREMHRKRRNTKDFRCQKCSMRFQSRHHRDQHFISHFQAVIDSVWQTVCGMQENLGDVIQSNQCPLCKFVMSSKRSFRLHVIHRHLLYDFNCVQKLIDTAERITNEKKSDRTSNTVVQTKEPVLKNRTGVAAKTGHKNCSSRKNLSNKSLQKNSEEKISSEKVSDMAPESGLLHTNIHHEVLHVQEETQTGEIPASAENKNATEHKTNTNIETNCLDHAVTEIFHDNTEIIEDRSKFVCEDNQNKVQIIPPRDESSEIRNRLIKECLDATNNSVRCVKCDCQFQSMFHFEVHLMRKHTAIIFNI